MKIKLCPKKKMMHLQHRKHLLCYNFTRSTNYESLGLIILLYLCDISSNFKRRILISQDQGFMSSYTVSSENLGLSVDCQLPPTSTKPPIHHRYSLSPEIERKFANYRNFTISPDTTDCDSNFGDGDSDLSSLMLVMEAESNAQASGQTADRLLYPSMPVLEDGLSSGHESDAEANNPTVCYDDFHLSSIFDFVSNVNVRNWNYYFFFFVFKYRFFAIEYTYSFIFPIIISGMNMLYLARI